MGVIKGFGRLTRFAGLITAFLIGSSLGTSAVLAAVCTDGQSGCVVFTRAFPPYQAFTIEVRVLWDGPLPFPSDPGGGAQLFYEGSSGEVGIGYSIDQGEYVLSFAAKFEGLTWYGVPAVPLSPLCDGAVHHIAAVHDFDANMMLLFIDGQLESSAPVPHAPLHISHYGSSLAAFGSGDRGFAYGSFSELRFWNRALPQEEIVDRMWQPLSGGEAGLIGYWRLDEGSGLTAHDSSPTGNSGDLVDGVVWCDAAIPTGACCQPNGACAVTDESHCTLPASWLGGGLDCDPNPCPQLGACCGDDGTCVVVLENSCLPESQWIGPGTPCEPNPCPQPGACCLGLLCVFWFEEDCNGLYQGDHVPCDPNPCPAAGLPEPALPARGVAVSPNPTTGSTTIRFVSRPAAETSIEVFGPDGTRIRRLTATTDPAGSGSALWDGRDDSGREAPSGIYLVRLATSSGDAVARIVKTR